MKKIFLFMVAALTLLAAISEAYIKPGPDRGPGYPRPRPGRPVYPPPRGEDPYPPAPYPGNPGYPYPGNPGYGTVSVPVYVDRYMRSGEQIDIGHYVNLYQYRGYRLVAIDFVAHSLYNSALIDIFINGQQVAPTLNLNSYPNNFRIFPNTNSYIGYGADSIVLYGRGDLNIRNVVLQLSR